MVTNINRKKAMKRHIYPCFLLLAVAMLLLSSCANHPDAPSYAKEVKSLPTIFPDYCNVTVPYNIAPLNFMLPVDEYEECVARLTMPDGQQQTYGNGVKVQIPESEWHDMLNASKGKSYTMYDHWSDIPEDAYLYSSAFTDCLCPHTLHTLPASSFSKTVRLIVRAPQLRSSERLAIIGSNKALGAWDSTKAVEMTEHNINEWVVDLNADDFPEGEMEFKFAALDSKKDVTPLWECSNNRTIDLPELKDGEVVVYDLDEAYMPIYNTKIAGTLVPVFSLRSKTSFGVGDFTLVKLTLDKV